MMNAWLKSANPNMKDKKKHPDPPKLMSEWLKRANPDADGGDDAAQAAAAAAASAGPSSVKPEAASAPPAGTTAKPALKRSAASAGVGSSSSSSSGPPAKRTKVYPSSNPEDGPAYLALERANMHPSWYWRLAPEFEKPYFKKLKEFLDAELASGQRVFPPPDDVYSWARIPFGKIRAVILGQDPYHGPNQAHGLCFSVRPGVPPPPSLVNIYKELEADVGVPRPNHGYLMGWARQGVLMLNSVLTVRQANANSHAKKGWETFTDAVVAKVNEEAENVVFILWGKPAQVKGAKINKSKHCVLQAPHPSPLAAHRGFFGSKPFSQANTYLEAHDRDPIDWSRLSIEDEPISDDEDRNGEDGGESASAGAAPKVKSEPLAATITSPKVKSEPPSGSAVKVKSEPPSASPATSVKVKSEPLDPAIEAVAAESEAALREMAENGLLEDW
ncbi:uracil DNA glycosylase [Blastocladiella emersonii ATCC 22665]|nr:uracil DNA glycosylase [Blastocladiella emersonii ATCC 22665]